MTAQTRWARGEFSWYELGTTDIDGSKKFYGALFGWTTLDVPMGQMGVYTMFRHDGEDLGGMYELEGPQLAGIPPHWMAYVAVDDVDADTARAKSLGGRAIVEPTNVPDVGRISVIQDPQGAMISMFQAGQHPGSGRWNGAASTFCWSELMTRDTAAAARFYTDLLGWSAKASPLGPGMSYTEWQVGGKAVGGMIAIDPSWGPMPPHWMNYIAVTDCDGTVSTARGLGGKTIVPPTDIPNVGRFSIVSDPSGAAFAVIKLG